MNEDKPCGKHVKEIPALVDGGLVYLASPYSDPSPEVREHRFKEACKAAAMLMSHGINIFSPIAHTHPIAEFGLPKDWEFWEAFDRLYLEASKGMIVLNLPGYLESKGVQAEIGIMKEMGKPVWYMANPDRDRVNK